MAKMADSRVETILAGNMGIYQATIRWRRSTEETFTDGRYSRAHEWLFEGERRPTAGEVESLHRRSHDACYVANSVRSEIQVDGKAEGIQ